MAIDTDGKLYGWGHNGHGQLGLGDYVKKNEPNQVGDAEDWVSVSAGTFHSAAINASGEIWTCGNNSYGILGNRTAGGGSNYNTLAIESTEATNWASVSAGFLHTMAIDTDGKLYGWGNNENGQLGKGTSDTNNNVTPTYIGTEGDNWKYVSAGGSHTVAIKTNGTLWTWGNNVYGQLALDHIAPDDPDVYTAPTQVGTATDWDSISAGYDYTMAIKTNGALWAWGYNDSGNLGIGGFDDTNVPTQVGTADWEFVSAGWSHTMAIKKDGTLWAWGYGWYGEFGDGTTGFRDTPVLIGGTHTVTDGDDGLDTTMVIVIAAVVLVGIIAAAFFLFPKKP